ncbi:MAG: hypothetical protein AAF497_00420 [Planctomycetota bacterium]
MTHSFDGLVLRTWEHLLRFCAAPLNLLVLLLLANSLWMPYRGIQHDARLYAFEVVNQLEDDVLHDELSLCYARAGKFSLFSTIVLPITKAIGVPASFFLIYLLSKTLFFAGLQSFVCSVIPKKSIAILSLLVIAGTNVGFGGMRVFNVNESFLTPRILATALVLFGLERLVRRRWFQSIGLMGLAMTIHPVMAVSGVLVWGLTLCMRLLSIRQQAVLYIVAKLAVAVVLIIPPLGLRVFGEMDSLWKDCVDDFNLYAFPQIWDVTDWVRIGIAFALVATGTMMARTTKQSRIPTWAIIAISAAGIIGSLIAVATPYALLFQGQSYRALWLVQLVQIPVGLLLARRLWTSRSDWMKFIAFYIATYFLTQSILPVVACCLFGAWIVSLRSQKLNIDTHAKRASSGAFGILLLLALIRIMSSSFSAVSLFPTIVRSVDAVFFWYYVAWTLGVLLSVLAVMSVPRMLARFGNHQARWMIIGLCLGISLTAFWLPYSPIRASAGFAEYSTLSMLKQHLNETSFDGDAPTIYWSRGRSGSIWHELHARSYLCTEQLAGTMFLRESALEGRRRARIVAPFELATFVVDSRPGPRWEKSVVEKVYGQSVTSEIAPTRSDLEKLTKEPIDVIVLRQNIDNLYDRTDGRNYLYDVRKLKKRISGSSVVAGI